MDIERYILGTFYKYFSIPEHQTDIIQKRRTTFKDDIEKSKRYFYKYVCSYIVVILLSFYLIKDKCIYTSGNNVDKTNKIHYQSKEEYIYGPEITKKLKDINLDTEIDFNIIMASRDGKSCQSNVKLILQNFYIYCIRGSFHKPNAHYNYKQDINGTYDSNGAFLDACVYLRNRKHDFKNYAMGKFTLQEILDIIDTTPQLIIPSILPVINTLRLYSNTFNIVRKGYTGHWVNWKPSNLKNIDSAKFEYKQPNADKLKLLFREISEVPLNFNVKNSNNTRKGTLLEYCLYNGYFEFINISYINTENTNRDTLIDLMRDGLTKKLSHFFNDSYVKEFIHKFFFTDIDIVVERIPNIIKLVLNLDQPNNMDVFRTISNDQSSYHGNIKYLTHLNKNEKKKFKDYFAKFRESYEIVHLFSILNAYKQCYRNLEPEYNPKKSRIKNITNKETYNTSGRQLSNNKNTNTPLLLENHRNRSQIQKFIENTIANSDETTTFNSIKQQCKNRYPNNNTLINSLLRNNGELKSKFNETQRIYEELKPYIENSSTRVLYDESGILRNTASITFLRNHAIEKGLNKNIVIKLLDTNTELTKLFENKKNTLLRQRLLEFKSQIDSAIGDDRLSIPPTLASIDYKSTPSEDQEKLKKIIKNWINAEKPTTTRHKNHQMKELNRIRFASFLKMAYLLLYFPNVTVGTLGGWTGTKKVMSITEWYDYRTVQTNQTAIGRGIAQKNATMVNDLSDFHKMRMSIDDLRDMIFLERYDVKKTRNNDIKKTRNNKLNISSEKLDIPVYAYGGFDLTNVKTHYKTLARQYPNTLFIFNDGITFVNGQDGNAEIRGMHNAMPIPLGAYLQHWSYSYAENITNKNSINRNTRIKLYNAYISENQVEPYNESDNLTFENIVDIAIYYIKEQCKKNNFNSIVYSSEEKSNRIGLGLFEQHTSQNIVDLVTTKLSDISQQLPSVVNYRDLIKNIRLPNNSRLTRQNAAAPTNMTRGGSKKVRKHQAIYQRGSKKGKLKPGYKYSGKKTKTGLKIIVKVKK